MKKIRHFLAVMLLTMGSVVYAQNLTVKGTVTDATMLDEKKMRQEQQSLVNTGDGFKKIIITKEALAPLYNEYGVLVMSIYDFLLDPDSMDL